MPWHEDGSDWTNKSAAELRPVIVSLCNAVGDRYQCIGLNRPEWPVNLDQDSIDITLGTKSAALVEEDLYGLELFRYGWWKTIADHIKILVGLRVPGASSTNHTYCRGWCKAPTDSGYYTETWTLEELETEVGMGEIEHSQIGVPYGHLFDEAFPNRLRNMLDLLIYPVIYLYQIGEIIGGGGETFLGFSEDAELDILANLKAGFPNPESPDEYTGDGDDAWPTMYSGPDYHTNVGVHVGFRVEGNMVGYCTRCEFQPVCYLAVDFDETQNGAGCLGEIVKQVYLVSVGGPYRTSFDVAVAGATASFPAHDSPFDDDDVEEVLGEELVTPSGTHELKYTMDNFGRAPSPGLFDYDHIELPDRAGFGSGYARVSCLYSSGTPSTPYAGAEQNSRVILDITAHCSDQ